MRTVGQTTLFRRAQRRQASCSYLRAVTAWDGAVDHNGLRENVLVSGFDPDAKFGAISPVDAWKRSSL